MMSVQEACFNSVHWDIPESPFVVSLSNHERSHPKRTALRQAQGERFIRKLMVKKPTMRVARAR